MTYMSYGYSFHICWLTDFPWYKIKAKQSRPSSIASSPSGVSACISIGYIISSSLERRFLFFWTESNILLTAVTHPTAAKADSPSSSSTGT